jgi:peptidoglycan hydrolase-like protein with peptidoglycan-binding domain
MDPIRLYVGDFGDAVARLHESLRKQGFQISSEEQKRKFFGPSTREVVRAYQRKHKLPVTGVVDAATQAVLEKATSATVTELPANQPSPKAAVASRSDGGNNLTRESTVGEGNGSHHVEGHINLEHGLPASKATIRLYTRGSRGEEIQLGESTADNQGFYTLFYRPVGKATNLEARMVDAEGRETPLTTTQPPAGKQEILNLAVPPSIQLPAVGQQRLAGIPSSIAGLKVETGAAATGIDPGKIERTHNLSVELQNDPEIYSVESDRVNFTEILREIKLPPNLVKSMAEAGVTSLSSIRNMGAENLTQISGITPDVAAFLTAQATLTSISPDIALNRHLIEAKITRVGEVAQLQEHELATRLHADVSDIRTLHQRAKVLRAAADVSFLDAVISLIPGNRLVSFADHSHLSEQILSLARPVAAPDACQTCDSCLSALSPSAYLVDLIDFLIDNFSAPPIGTASGIVAKGFTNLDDLDNRFRRSFKNLVIGCDDADQSVMQIEIAIEVLEKFITTPPVTGYSRDLIYGGFDYVDPWGRTLPKPDILSRMFDAYLSEMGVTRTTFGEAIGKAYPVGGAQPDLTSLNELLNHLGVAEALFKAQLDIQSANWKPTIKALDWMPTLVRTYYTKTFDPNDLQQLVLFHDALDQAAAAIARVKEYALPDIRTNLIAEALRQLKRADIPSDLAAITTAKQLGNYLHIDLATDPCMTTTRLASAIEAIQSFVFAFTNGREDPGYFLRFQGGIDVGSFEARWRWMKSYGLWHAAQSVLLYPENFLMPSVRHNKTTIFDNLLSALDGLNSADDRAIDDAVNTYRQAALNSWSLDGIQFYELPVTNDGLGLAAFSQLQSADYARQVQIRATNNQSGDAMRVYLDEWYFYVPLAVADFLSRMRQFERAAAWFHVVFYPFTAQYPPDFPFPPIRLIWWGFSEVRDQSYVYRNTVEWLTDPFAPFAVAQTRQGAFVRHVIIRYVDNLLDWADAEFSCDTSESVSRARELYELAEDILHSEEISQEEACSVAWQEFLAFILATYSTEEVRLLRFIIEPTQNVGNRLTLADIAAMQGIVEGDDPIADRTTKLNQLVDQILGRQTPAKTISEIAQERAECQAPALVEDAFIQPIGSPGFPSPIWKELHLSPELSIVEFTLNKIGCGFCVPPNPLLGTLRSRIQINLEKIRTCRNATGMRRTMRASIMVAPLNAVQQSASSDNLDELIPSEPPPVFRFSYLIERARYYVQVAQQLESQLLNAFEKEDAENYSLMKAQQDMQIAGATLNLQDLRVTEASDQFKMAIFQVNRAQFQETHYRDLISMGFSDQENKTIIAYGFAIAASELVPIQEPGAIATLSAYGASLERRKEEWNFQLGLAKQDMQIADSGVRIANDSRQVAEKERAIANLHNQFANEVVNFLTTKFTNKDLWKWMGLNLRRYLREHLNMATVIARMAQTSLAFERQAPITIVSPYYADREHRDLLIADQLLTDINRLDQHRLTTQKRLKELTKTISLDSISPIEFEQLRRDGWMEFATLINWFDRDFPGHYMRLIKYVSLSIVAIVPPGEAIHATLSNNGISRVMVGAPYTEYKQIQRQPESIAITKVSDGTGLFEVHLDDPILLPFEGSGVEATWRLEMPKGANRFDFDTLVDVLFTIRYTSQEDPVYRDRVLQQMGIDQNGKVSVDGTTSFSLSQSFPDAWYLLNNPPHDTPSPYAFEFELRRRDFPPNELDHTIKRLNLAFRQERPIKLPLEIEYQPQQAGETYGPIYSVQLDYEWNSDANTGNPIALSALQDGAGTAVPLSTLRPLGRWTLRLRYDADRNAYAEFFQNATGQGAQTHLDLNWLQDALLVLTYDAVVEYKYG